MVINKKLRNVIFILLGVLLLIYKPYYNGPFISFVKSYLGNFAVSFVVYFIVGFYSKYWNERNIINAILALTVVTLFELTNGFGVMINVYDMFDLIANLLGISLAFVIDKITNNYLRDKY